MEFKHKKQKLTLERPDKILNRKENCIRWLSNIFMRYYYFLIYAKTSRLKESQPVEVKISNEDTKSSENDILNEDIVKNYYSNAKIPYLSDQSTIEPHEFILQSTCQLSQPKHKPNLINETGNYMISNEDKTLRVKKYKTSCESIDQIFNQNHSDLMQNQKLDKDTNNFNNQDKGSLEIEPVKNITYLTRCKSKEPKNNPGTSDSNLSQNSTNQVEIQDEIQTCNAYDNLRHRNISPTDQHKDIQVLYQNNDIDIKQQKQSLNRNIFSKKFVAGNQKNLRTNLEEESIKKPISGNNCIDDSTKALKIDKSLIVLDQNDVRQNIQDQSDGVSLTKKISTFSETYTESFKESQQSNLSTENSLYNSRRNLNEHTGISWQESQNYNSVDESMTRAKVPTFLHTFDENINQKNFDKQDNILPFHNGRRVNSCKNENIPFNLQNCETTCLDDKINSTNIRKSCPDYVTQAESQSCIDTNKIDNQLETQDTSQISQNDNQTKIDNMLLAIRDLIKKYSNANNIEAKNSFFFIRKKHVIIDQKYLDFLLEDACEENIEQQQKSVDQFIRVGHNKSELVDIFTTHKLQAICCQITIKFYLDEYEPEGLYAILFSKRDYGKKGNVKKESYNALRKAENLIFLDVLEGNLKFVTTQNYTN